MNFQHLQLRLESMIENSLGSEGQLLKISGTNSSLLLSTLLANTKSKYLNRLPHVVVCASSQEAQRIKDQMEFFDPGCRVYICESFDVSPYSGLYPRPSIAAKRMGFLWRLQKAQPFDIFLLPVDAAVQKTLPFDQFQMATLTLKIGDELPANFSSFLFEMGYRAAPLVEDYGHYSTRGGIIDIFSPFADLPVRIELFGDQIESLRHFNINDQMSTVEITQLELVPAKEYLFDDTSLEQALGRIRHDLKGRDLVPTSEKDELLRSLSLKQDFPGIDFLVSYFAEELSLPLDYLRGKAFFWALDPEENTRRLDDYLAELKTEHKNSETLSIRPPIESLFSFEKAFQKVTDSVQLQFSNLETLEHESSMRELVYKTSPLMEFSSVMQMTPLGTDTWNAQLKQRLSHFKSEGDRIFVSTKNRTSAERLKLLFENSNFECQIVGSADYQWDTWLEQQEANPALIHFIPRALSDSLRMPEESLLFLRDDDLLGKKQRTQTTSSQEFQKNAKRLSFGDLKPGDLVVHVKHGIGVYEGLKIMAISGVDSEYIQVAYKDKDKLYLPVYRVGQLQRYSGANEAVPLDKLGGTGWEKTTAKVKKHLKDIALELIQLYSLRAELHRPALTWSEKDLLIFENSFPFSETTDQLRALSDIEKDLHSDKPMDRLICGDVGFGKTEVAMRAAFLAIQSGKQVAVLAPTTVLTFQHFETFKKRFAGWPIDIRVLNRFVSSADVKKTVAELKTGQVNLVIGTHKLLSSSIDYKELGLLIIDEEQKFGVTHKEKIKKLKTSVDTLTLSATPIPRTLNMSLVGIRDLSLINTAPVDRLPTRTFVTKFDPETIRKACESEISRGGQVYFIHNRIQSIYGVADEIRAVLPTARIRVAHGQMPEDELEKAMLTFFNHEIDILICTAIVESGMDVPRANTMFIDGAHMFGLSQLYQLRGRVGRSKTRAYCYLLMPRTKKLDPDQQERLKIIQDNTALGSGLKIAQYDLELRGSGNLLGADQSGHVNSIGYEMYMDLLNESLAEAKGEAVADRDLDPEINLRVPAMIPDSYIKDIRIRLSFYKALAEIQGQEDLDQIEAELRDQFGDIPEPTINLMGLMLIRKQCRDLGVRDVSAGLKNISLIFTERTRLKPEIVIGLAMRENKKYSLTPDNRLNIRLNNISWQAVYEELSQLIRLI